MDNVKIFDTLERKVEKLLGRLRSLESENEKQRQDIERVRAELATARKSEKESSEARGAIERLEKDQEAVRERVEKLIASLEAAESGGKS
jgi:predicted RNase H-like nuclease (RuvC/YqgF family)